MNIPMPKGMKSPTVVIVGGGTMSGDEKMNKMHEKRMDMLERKLDQQYKDKSEGRNYAKDIESIQKSFVKKLDKVITQNKQSMESQNSKLLDALKKTVSRNVKVIKQESRGIDGGEIKTFLKKIDSLEEAIRKISLKTKTIHVSRNIKLDDSFQKMFERLESAIKSARPRVYPSPS